MGFNLDDYDPVEERLAKFWADHPEGRVLTSLVSAGGGEYIVRAEVYTNRDDDRPAASGYAQEVTTQKGVNSTSALENCETSAIGRALANSTYAAKRRPSREEMEKVQRRAGPDLLAQAKADAWTAGQAAGLDLDAFTMELRAWSGVADAKPGDVTDVETWRAFTAVLQAIDPTAEKPSEVEL